MQGLLPLLADVGDVEVVVCPPFPWLPDVARLLSGSGVRLGAQNIHTQDGGAYTGEVSPRMLAGLCQYVLVGQYERRIYFSEKDAIVRQKVLAALKHGLRPVLCVGETADQLDDGTGGYVITGQLEAVLEDAPVDGRLVVAPPPLSYVAEMCELVRQTLGRLLPAAVAEAVRVVYAGQVNPRNAAAVAADGGGDGVLVGAASTHPQNFASIAHAFSAATRALPGA